MLLNATKIGNKQYHRNMMNGKKNLKDLKLSDDFYGGMVREFGKVKDEEGILMVLDRTDNVIDLLITNLATLTNNRLKAICTLKDIPYPKSAVKDDLIKLIKGA